jgi:hypothetical protein
MGPTWHKSITPNKCTKVTSGLHRPLAGSKKTKGQGPSAISTDVLLVVSHDPSRGPSVARPAPPRPASGLGSDDGRRSRVGLGPADGEMARLRRSGRTASARMTARGTGQPQGGRRRVGASLVQHLPG